MAPFGLRALPSPKSHVNRHNITKIRLMGSIRLFWLHKVVVIFNFVYVLQHLLFSVTEPQLRTKPSSVSDVVDAPEILAVIGKIPFLSEFMNSLYECQYKSFFSAFVGITEHINLDRYLHLHFCFYMREIRTVVYSQFLESYKSVTIEAMAKAFSL
ncbi:unnamed protein product [Lactuca saligna]|uniref:PCI domain-containing protein n=1 Tax=Lactuca saligna TaxID=75948 RepID=A0AA35Y7T6_LACSI|nr:unnamed protein product [Lactuca saligna]